MPASKAKNWTIGTLITSVVTIGGGLGGNEFLDWKIDQRLSSKKGGFRTALSEEIGVKPELIPHEFGKMYHWMDSVQKFQRETMPLVRDLKSTTDVGLKVNKNNGRVMYMHLNGHPYRAFKDTVTGRYYFINDNNQSEYCK